jgi:hypothetical protein
LGAASIFITMIIALTGRMSAGLAGLMITSGDRLTRVVENLAELLFSNVLYYFHLLDLPVDSHLL